MLSSRWIPAFGGENLSSHGPRTPTWWNAIVLDVHRSGVPTPRPTGVLPEATLLIREVIRNITRLKICTWLGITA